MEDKAIRLIKAFLSLTETEKNQIIDFIKEYEGLGYFEKAERSTKLDESFRLIMGPLSQGKCSLCGK